MTGYEHDPMYPHIRDSNLIERVDSSEEDERSVATWHWLMREPKITPSVVLGTHRRIMKELRPDIAGQFRTGMVTIRSIATGHFVDLPPPDRVPDLIRRWCNALEKPHEVDAKEAHIAFEKIHPFEDGNGRTGRMLMWLHELWRGEQPTRILFKDRFDYYWWFVNGAT